VSDEFGYDEPEPARGPDPQIPAARAAVLELFASSPTQVFFSRQVEVRLEKEYFHWITNRAIRELVADGEIKGETVKLNTGGEIHLLWPKQFRYFRRSAKRVIELVESYSVNSFSRLVGYTGEMLVGDAFATAQFTRVGRETRKFAEREWTTSSHDLDFVVERDGFAYGVEVKNTLGYMREEELNIKIAMCEELGVTPLFVVRYMPATWFNRVREVGGFVLMLKYQLYPLSHVELARAVREELGMPVHAPAALFDSTLRRFTAWHDDRVNSE
jgi:hypothetical protein